jgi:predicted nuclease of predicted toxin-antitoxin system
MKAAEVLARAAGLTSENVNVANISINIIQQLNALHEAYEEGKLTEKEIPIDTMKDMKLEG